MKFVFLILFAFSNLIIVNASFSQSKNFCASDAVGKKYELNLVEGAGRITAKTYSSSGALIGTLNGTWSIQNEGVYGSAYFLTAVFSSGAMKFLVISDGTGDIQKLQDVVANREFYPCNGSSTSGNSISFGSITVEGNGSSSEIDKTIIPSQIIGNSIKIGQLEIAQNDFNWEMGWDDAKKSIEQLGEGWRLPTKSEFDIIIKNKSSLLFGGDTYWTSTKYREQDVNPQYYWYYNFNPGKSFGRNEPGAFQCNTDKGAWLSVRAVRTIQ